MSGRTAEIFRLFRHSRNILSHLTDRHVGESRVGMYCVKGCITHYVFCETYSISWLVRKDNLSNYFTLIPITSIYSCSLANEVTFRDWQQQVLLWIFYCFFVCIMFALCLAKLIASENTQWMVYSCPASYWAEMNHVVHCRTVMSLQCKCLITRYHLLYNWPAYPPAYMMFPPCDWIYVQLSFLCILFVLL